MPRTRFRLLEDPATARYAPMVEACVPELLAGNRDAPDFVALLLERPGPPELVFAPAEEVAAELLEMATRTGPEAHAALRDVAMRVVRQRPGEPGFDCVVVRRDGCAILRLPSQSLAEQGIAAVASTVARLRGFEEADPGQAPLPLRGAGYAIRAEGCAICGAWAEALRAARIPLVGRVAPVPPALEGEVCTSCSEERETLRRIAAAEYGLSPEATDRAADPATVMVEALVVEDLRAFRG